MTLLLLVYAYIAFMANEIARDFLFKQIPCSFKFNFFILHWKRQKYLHQSSNPGFIDNFVVVHKVAILQGRPSRVFVTKWFEK